MRTLPAALKAQINKLGGGEPFTWLFAIAADEDYDTETGTALYVTSYDQPVTFTDLLNDPPGNQTYRPLAASVSSITIDMSASVPTVQVSVSNVYRTASKRLEMGKGFMGCRCKFVVVDVSRLADGAVLEGEGFVRNAVASAEAVTFGVELYGLASIEIPGATFIVDRCRYEYGDAQCGFRLDLVTGGHPAEMLRCSKTYADCVARGDFTANTLNRTRLHPMRFGGFLGMPRLARR